MLSPILSSSYKRYKEDTNIFTTWLSQSAKACGYTFPNAQPDSASQSSKLADAPPKSQPPSTRLKGKARKEAKKSSEGLGKADGPQGNREQDAIPIKKYQVASKDILDQAETVARSVKPRVRVPVNILRIIRRAIDARKRCAEWFQKTAVKNETSVKGHAHFINVLEQALAILEPCQRQPGSGESKTPAVAPNAGTHASTDEVAGESMKNRFQGLTVEDTDDLLDIAASDIVAVPNRSSTKTKPSRDVYELESWHDLAFYTFCLFEDLHRMQDFVQAMWRKVATGECNITTASILTDIAIYLARRAEEDVLACMAKFPTGPHPYEVLAHEIFCVESLSKGEDPKAKLLSSDSLKITPFDDFIYLSTARTLMKFARMAELKVEYPQPVPRARFSYISRPELLELPEIKKWEAEDEFLSQMLMDLSLNDHIANAMKKNHQNELLVLDHLGQGLLQVREKHKVAVWTVFASRLLLDVQEILGDRVGTSYQELLTAAKLAEKTLDLKTEGDRLVPGGGGERWLTKDSVRVNEINVRVQLQILHYPFVHLKEKMLADYVRGDNQYRSLKDLPEEWQGPMDEYRRAKGLPMDSEIPQVYHENRKKIGSIEIEPAQESNYIFTHNPVSCGMLAFNLKVDMEEAGITLANHHLTIFAFSHLYNALRQLNRVTETWTEIDEVIRLHAGVLFCGQLPTTPKEFDSRFALRLGLSATAFARNPRAASSNFHLRNQIGPRLTASSTSTIFRQYFDQKGAQPLEKYLYQFEKLTHQASTENQPNPKKSKASSSTPRNYLTPLQILTQMSDWLSTHLTDMNIDCITLTRTCNTILRRVRERVNDALGTEYHSVRHEDSNEPINLTMVFFMLREASELHSMIENICGSDAAAAQQSVHLAGSPQLEIAGEVVQAFLREQNRGN